MRHIRKITVARADAFLDFVSAVRRAYFDYRFGKKNTYIS